MWGKPAATMDATAFTRIIPTRVGKTEILRNKSNADSDHPHPCGENPQPQWTPRRLRGSSPPVWGKPGVGVLNLTENRIIPTRVGKTDGVVRDHIKISDHPHPCGENFSKSTHRACISGSSPPVWGKLFQVQVLSQYFRIIPTRVGKTDFHVRHGSSLSDHPHPCGENDHLPPTCHRSHGSSPPVWGKHAPIVHHKTSLRIIPTRVGKTPKGGRYRCGNADHPHPCGENQPRPLHQLPRGGSSPPVWGKQFVYAPGGSLPRIIPTRVGKTSMRPPCSRGVSDHPHPCGENFHSGCFHIVFVGSSPPVWGKRKLAKGLVVERRIIPTRVGKTSVSIPNDYIESDHPHPCGENHGGIFSTVRSSGSSPPVWGKPMSLDASGLFTRIIPTRVGKTSVISMPTIALPDHPHPCGENLNAANKTHLKTGSSPPVWGKHPNGANRLGESRIIPTRVGKTPGDPAVHYGLGDHPHPCGENVSCQSKWTRKSGSSPPVWGKRTPVGWHRASQRIIPTRVGKTGYPEVL